MQGGGGGGAFNSVPAGDNIDRWSSGGSGGGGPGGQVIPGNSHEMH
jgi:hypothetical protein